MEESSLRGSEIGPLDVIWRPTLDAPIRGVLDRLAAFAAKLFDAPAALMKVNGTDLSWVDPTGDIDLDDIRSDPRLDGSAVQQDGPWLVEDARLDPRTRTHPLVLGDFGLRFYLGVPLRTRDGLALGSLCVIDRTPHHASPAQVAGLLDLAALVTDQLELHADLRESLLREQARRRQAEEISESLEESLRPAELPAVPGLELASRYQPADGEVVGGDFYDAFPAQSDWGLVIGDVRGHGPSAASLTATARHALKALAQDSWSPARSLGLLNKLILQQATRDPELFCTVALLRVTTMEVGQLVTVSLAGHPLPLLVRTDGSVRAVGIPGTALGMTATPSLAEVSVLMRPGDTLVMYTDGVTDAGTKDALFGEAALRSLLTAKANHPPGEIAGAVEHAVADFDPDPDDDVAVLVAQAARRVTPVT